MRRAVFLSLLSTLLCALLIPAIASAQGLGAINGTVTDPSGSAVPSAKITATQSGTSFMRDADSNSDGFYVLPSLAPAIYHLSISATGFKATKEDVTVLADQSLTVNFQLAIGAATETVTISGTALSVDTTTSTLRQVVESTRLNELPLNGRNVAQLTLTVAGVENSGNGGSDQGQQKTFPGAYTVSVNGTRGNQSSYLLDGGNYVDEYTNVSQPFPFPDELQEFSIQTSNYSAEYGQNAGGVVNVITKSGTNEFHGDVFEYARQPRFNALSYFADQGPAKSTGGVFSCPLGQTLTAANHCLVIDRFKRNQYGGTVGGPIFHNKTYFFAGYQRSTWRNLQANSSHAPGLTDISNYIAAASPVDAAGDLIDPAVAKMIGVNSKTGADLGSGAAFHLVNGAVPAGSNPNVSYLKPIIQNYDSGMGRLDHQLTANDKITARYEFDRFITPPTFSTQSLLTYDDGSTIISQNALVHETHTFSAMVLNDVRLSYSRDAAVRGPATGAPNGASFGVTGLSASTPPAIQGIAVQNAFSFGTNPHGQFVRNNLAFSDDVSWEKGRHDIHFGGTVERSQVDLINQFFQPGTFDFFQGGAKTLNGNTTQGGTYGSFLEGVLGDGGGAGNGLGFQQGAGEFKKNRNTFSGVYFEDNLRVSHRLTVNLGVRYEPALSWREEGGRYSQVNIALMQAGVTSITFPNSPPGIFYAGDPQMSRNGMNDSLNDIAPRFGFAWDVFGDGKTSVRGGAGIFYDSRSAGILDNRFVDEWPFSPQFVLSVNNTATGGATAGTVPGTFSDPLCAQASTQTLVGCNGTQAASYATTFPTFPPQFPPSNNIVYPPNGNNIALTFDPSGKYNVPTIYSYNLTIERQLPWQSLFRVAYVGSQSRHLLETIDMNPAPLGSAFSATPNCPAALTKFGVGLLNCILAGKGFSSATLDPKNTQCDCYDINSHYNAGEVSFEKRTSHGLTLLVNYTYSKSNDDMPWGQGLTGFDGNYSRVPFNVAGRHTLDWGPSYFDATHVVSLTYVYQTPALTGHSLLVRRVLGDYELGGVYTYSTGLPFTVVPGKDIAGTNIGNNVNFGTLCGHGAVVNSSGTNGTSDTCLVGTSPYSSATCAGQVSCKSWLTPVAFEPATVTCVNTVLPACLTAGVGKTINNPAIFGTYGNLGKDTFRYPNIWGFDMSLSKSILFTERLRLQLRADYFNIFNHPTFAPIDTSLGSVNGTNFIGSVDGLNSGSFGTFRNGQQGDPRIAQLSVKFVF